MLYQTGLKNNWVYTQSEGARPRNVSGNYSSDRNKYRRIHKISLAVFKQHYFIIRLIVGGKNN